MKTFRIFILLLVGILLYSCDSQSIPSKLPGTMGDIRSRGIIKDSSLPIGSKALFNLSGDMTLINEIITFDGTSWGIDEELTISDHASKNLLTVLCPAYNDENNLITQNPYIENALEDVLIAQKTWSGQTNIELEFSHLFAMLTIHVETSLNASLTDIAVEAPKVTSIKGNNGSFETSDNQTHTTTLDKNTTGEYSFIIPSIDNCPLTLIFNFGEEQASHTLTHDFKSGFKYECNVIDEDTRPGIRTADDLINFCQLINGELPKAQWSRFGYIEGEDTVYCLLNDIKITENKEFLPIGYYYKQPFSAIFDGNNHCISGLNISAFYGVAGLFGIISPTGTIKNLHLNYCSSSIIKNASTGIGFIAGTNYGTINNCSVTNSNISISENSPTGGIAGHLRSGGYIINSYVQNTNIASAGYVGGIVGEMNQANIINCYVTSSSVLIKESAYSGGIAGYANNSNIINCYKHNITIDKSGNRGQIIGSAQNTTVDYIFYDQTSPQLIYNTDKTNSTPFYKRYNTESFKTIVGGMSVDSLLNSWISEQTSYSHTFNTWEASKERPAIFQQ